MHGFILEILYAVLITTCTTASFVIAQTVAKISRIGNAWDLYPEILGSSLVEDTDLRKNSDYFRVRPIVLTHWFV